MHPLCLQPLYFRESTLAHYGKRGILYHGACVVWVDVDTGELVLRYFDQTSDGDSKQDVGAVISLCELIVHRVKQANPKLETADLQVRASTCISWAPCTQISPSVRYLCRVIMQPATTIRYFLWFCRRSSNITVYGCDAYCIQKRKTESVSFSKLILSSFSEIY
jgi:hypothetical protein